MLKKTKNRLFSIMWPFKLIIQEQCSLPSDQNDLCHIAAKETLALSEQPVSMKNHVFVSFAEFVNPL